MRFAIAAIDRYLGVFEAFVHAGWKPLKLFTVPMRSDLANQQAVINYAEQHQASIQLSRMTTQDLTDLREQGCEALIIASYDWKIPDWRPLLKYAVNFHCSPLPDGRGPYPSVRAIMDGRRSWGVSCHQLTQDIDKGDILAAENFPLQFDECHESLDLKIQMTAKRLGARVATQFVSLWEQAKPQAEGSYWNKYELNERVVDFHKPVEQIMRHIRAFGATESLVNVNNTWFIVRRAVGWAEKHRHAPGQVVHVFNKSIVMSASDGYIGILDGNIAPQHVVAEMQAYLNSRASSQ